MRNGMIKAAGLLGFALLLAGIVIATDSSFYWSDASGARGTLYWDSICLSNSTFGGTIVGGTTLSGNGSGLTNLHAGNLTAGNAGLDRLTNAAATLGPYIGGNVPNSALSNAAATLVVALYVPLTSLTNAIPPLTTNDCVASLVGPTNRVVFNVYGVKISSTQL